MAFVIAESLLNIVFFLMMFLNRNVKDEFKMNRELRTMTVWRYLSDVAFIIPIVFFPNSPFVVLGCA